MFMRFLTTLLLIMSMVAFYSMPASADGGWVLWLKKENISWNKDSQPSESISWEILGAVPKFEQCTNLQKETWDRRKAFWNDSEKTGVKKVDGRKPDLLFISIGKSKDEVTLRITEALICLPSPLDPRERK
jgi:hypothetical protein